MERERREFAWGYVGYVPSAEQRAAHMDEHRLKLVAGQISATLGHRV